MDSCESYERRRDRVTVAEAEDKDRVQRKKTDIVLVLRHCRRQVCPSPISVWRSSLPLTNRPMATTTVRPKPARTTSKRASSANANVNSNTTLTLHLNVNADARSRATNIAGTSTTQRAKPQGGQVSGTWLGRCTNASGQWYSDAHVCRRGIGERTEPPPRANNDQRGQQPS